MVEGEVVRRGQRKAQSVEARLGELKAERAFALNQERHSSFEQGGVKSALRQATLPALGYFPNCWHGPERED